VIRFAIALAASLIVPALAHAAPGDATRLEYARSERAARCPDRDALRSAVKKRLGYDPFFPAARQTIAVEITDAGDGLRAQMHLIDENGMIVGSRELKDKLEQCEELVASLALAISIALDPSAVLGLQAGATTERTAPAESPSSGDEAPLTKLEPAAESTPGSDGSKSGSAVKNAAPRGDTVGLAFPSTVRAAAFSTLGGAPSLAFGLRAGIGLRWRWFQLLTELADQLPATHTAEGVGSVRASLYAGTLAPCVVRGSFAGCAVFNLGSLQAEGRDVNYPVKQHSLYAALGPRVEVTPRLARQLHLLLTADALTSLTPVTLRLQGEQVWKTPLLSAVLAVGLAWQFP
jgi:hypothetical protein